MFSDDDDRTKKFSRSQIQTCDKLRSNLTNDLNHIKCQLYSRCLMINSVNHFIKQLRESFTKKFNQFEAAKFILH